MTQENQYGFLNTKISSIIRRLEEIKAAHGNIHVRMMRSADDAPEPIAEFLLLEQEIHDGEQFPRKEFELGIVGSWNKFHPEIPGVTVR